MVFRGMIAHLDWHAQTVCQRLKVDGAQWGVLAGVMYRLSLPGEMPVRPAIWL
jgi:hypothetical protein